MRLFRPTLRFRMALLYGGLVLLVGVSLLITSVILVEQAVRGLQIFAHGAHLVDAHGRPIQGGGAADLQRTAESQAVHYLLDHGLLFYGLIVLIGASGGYLVARQALRPIARVTRTARQLSTETLDQRINLGGPDDELRELADTFDDMLGRLDAAFDSQRLFVANASHELRTPLSVIRTELDVTLSDDEASAEELRRMGEMTLIATERAQRLVSSLLTLARLQAGGRRELEISEPVDLAGVVQPALDAVEGEVAERSITVEIDVAHARTVGDPRLLERLVGNLVENGIRHNVDGGWLRVTSGETDSRVWLHVANGGRVIDPNEIEAMFEPFRRGAGRVRTASKGAGLGLSIVRLIVEAHHGKLQAAAPPFGGLAIRVELPRRQTSSAAGIVAAL